MPIDYGTNNVTTSGNINVSGVVTATSGVFSNLTIGGSSFNSAVSGLLPTIANSGNDRILTSTGSTVGVNAESNLTFDGTNLLVASGDATIGGLKALKWNGNTWGYDKIVFRQDVNNKITSDSSGNYNWLVVGKNWTLSDVGNVGIGTLSPQYKLDVVGDAEFGANDSIRLIDTGAGNARIAFSGAGSVDCGTNFTFRNNAGTVEYARVSANGNVGIGTISPSQKLSVSGNAIIGTESSTRIGITGAGGTTSIAEYYLTEANPRWVLGRDTGGAGVAALGFSLNSTLAAGGAAVGHPATRALGLYTSNATALVERVRISASGDVGIGTTAPSGRLNVIGTGLFSSTTGIAPNALLDLYSATSGDMIFNVEGTNGSLFSVIDNLSGTLMSVNNNAGLPVFEVFSDDKVVAGRYNQNDFVVSSGGNIGIGTASPSYKLEVIGTGNFSRVLESGNIVRNKTLTYFTALDNQPPASGFATLDTRNSIAVLDFDDTTEESAVFIGLLPENASLASGISTRIHWVATSGTTGNCRWGVQFERMNTDLDSDSFDTATEDHSATNATAGIITTTTLTCTSIDSLIAGDLFRLKVYRDVTDTTNDTMIGDAELIAVELRSVS